MTIEIRTIATASVILLLAAAPALASPEVPGAEQQQPIAIVGATIHPVSGPPIEGGVLVFEGGKITAVGKSAPIPQGARRVSAEGKHVYPGLIDALSNIGLVEINAVRATRDYSETGQLNPNVKALVAVNPDSELIPVTRSNGVLLAVSAPSGGLISGVSAVLQLDGWTWEEMGLLPAAGMHVDWPRMAPASDWMIEKSAREQMDDRDEALQRLERAFENARAYQKARAADDSRQLRDARWEAMLPVLSGELPIVADADDAEQIQAAVAFALRQNVKLIIYGGYDAEECAPLLKKHDVPVIIAGVHRLPERRDDHYDSPFTLPQRLRAAGVKFCIAGTGRFGASNVRNLPYHAATAAAYGLPPDVALKSITLFPAEILGVADKVGSLQPGKHATLFLSDGDPLETATNIEAAYIQGRAVDLNDRHKRLWRKYEEKLRRAGLAR